jgi:NDP-sugar pyrophosphorylase family protein
MQAIILAGGKGTRLQPYTTVLPKPLMPVGDYPILEILIRQLARDGFKKIVLTIGYHIELFQALFRDGGKWGIDIEYSLENKPLGTIGPLRQISDLEDDFLVINGDTLTDLSFTMLRALHLKEKNTMTIATKKRSMKVNYGVIEDGDDNYLVGYEEKPVIEYKVAMGVYVLSKGLLDLIPKDQRYDFPDLVHEMVRKGMKIRCFNYEGYWLDIGRPEDYQIAVEQFSHSKEMFLGKGNEV